MERLGSLGYMALIKEVTKGTPLTPADYVSLYEENLTTDQGLVEQNPAVGTKSKIYSLLQGQRSHKGEFTVMAEPNTAAKIFDMFMKKGVTSGAGPYTHPFTIDKDTNPNSYTVDLSTGNQVFRYMGVEASQIDPAFQGNEMRLKVKVSALKAFSVREIATVNTTTITLKTDYDAAPNVGLVANDLVRITKADGSSSLDTTVSTVNADGITVILGTSAASYAAGDFISLRPATAAYTQKTPFQWARTQFCFGADSTAALAGTQTRIEQGSAWSLIHAFESDNGAERSGSYDPAALVRTTADASLKVKKFFDTPNEVNNFLKRNAGAVVIRHFSETGYELRVTISQITMKTGGKPAIKTGAILYHDMDYDASYDVAETQVFDVKVLNNLATI